MDIKTLLAALALPLLALAQNATLSSPGALPTIEGGGPVVGSDGKYVIQSEGITVYAIPYAATLSNLFIKDVHNVTRDIVLGIKNGTFTIDGYTYHTNLNDNNGLDTLHGGSNGWDYRNWTVVAHTTDSITFSLVDPDNSLGMGFPGEVIAYITYTLTPYQWHLRMTALSTTKKTPIMLSSHTYWNLDGFQNPSTPLALNYSLHLPYGGLRTEIDNIEIPTGNLLGNEQYSVNDFWSAPKQLGANISAPALQGNCGYDCTGYDNCYIFNRDAYGPYNWQQAPVATLASPYSGIQIDIFTDQDAFQVYTCNNMNGTFALKETQGFFNDSSRPRVANKYGCVAMEVEDWIDGINNPQWGRNKKQIFGPGDEPYVLEATYNFSLNHSLAATYDGQCETPPGARPQERRRASRMPSQSAKYESQMFERQVYERIPEAIRASNRLQDALGLRTVGTVTNSEPGAPLWLPFAKSEAAAPSNIGASTTSDWRGHMSETSVDSTIDAEHEMIDGVPEDVTAQQGIIPEIVIHAASPRPEDIEIRRPLGQRKRQLSGGPVPQMHTAIKRPRVLDTPFEMVPRHPKQTSLTLFADFPPALPPPKHKDPGEEYAEHPLPTYWRHGLSHNLTVWLQHPATHSAQIPLLSLRLNMIALNEQQQNDKLYFRSDGYDRLDSFRIRLPMAHRVPHTQDWLVYVCVSAGMSGDGFDSDFEEDEDDDEDQDQQALPYWVMMVQMHHVVVISTEAVEEEESEGLGSPLLSEGGDVRRDKIKTRFLIDRVPLVHGRGVDPRFAEKFFIACGYGSGVFDVVSEGPLPLDSV
ncbi:hypothetical protein LTR86_010685 [Recurvomyces mirabilis]|nr:hypothetical protein LTR86_010685 [Recurvomyces mirabilis]